MIYIAAEYAYDLTVHDHHVDNTLITHLSQVLYAGTDVWGCSMQYTIDAISISSNV